MTFRWQCKNIPDEVVLETINRIAHAPEVTIQPGETKPWNWVLPRPVNLTELSIAFRDDLGIVGIPDDGATAPAHLVRAKLAKMIRKGLVDGCACGCRGDFEVKVTRDAELE